MFSRVIVILLPKYIGWNATTSRSNFGSFYLTREFESFSNFFFFIFQSLTPPTCLLDYHPLMELCNGIIAEFNELRYCNPYACSFTVTTLIQQSLESVSRKLSSYFEREHLTWFDNEEETFSNLCHCYFEKLVPFVQRCLITVYNPNVIAKYFGFTVAEMENEVTFFFFSILSSEFFDRLLLSIKSFFLLQNVVYLNSTKIRQCFPRSHWI